MSIVAITASEISVLIRYEDILVAHNEEALLGGPELAGRRGT